MPDRLIFENGKVVATTEEGRRFEAPESSVQEALAEMYRPALNGALLPDGAKGIFSDSSNLVLVHQSPPACRAVTWIANDSPADYGPETQYRKVRLSFPYTIVFAGFVRHRGALQLTGHNELYFSNQPIRSERDRLGFPALLNVSHIAADNRVRSWICTQHLDGRGGGDLCGQLQGLLNHVWSAAFNRSSERHEGLSMYQFSAGIHPQLHPVEGWQEASRRNSMFALEVPWKPAPLTVGELARTMLDELTQEPMLHLLGPRARRMKLSTQLIRYLQKKDAASAGEEEP